MKINKTNFFTSVFANISHYGLRSLFPAFLLFSTASTGILCAQTISNPSFEETKKGTPVNWKLGKGFSIEKDGRGGENCLAVVGDGKKAALYPMKCYFRSLSPVRCSTSPYCNIMNIVSPMIW